MAIIQDHIERFYKSGKMPKYYYYQQNGKTASQNYIEQREEIQKEILERVAQSESIEEQIENAIVKALGKIF